MGARASKDGLSATCYPTGVSAVPIEVLEASIPIEFTTKELCECPEVIMIYRRQWPKNWFQNEYEAVGS